MNNRRQELPEGVYSVRQARANIKDLIDRVAAGNTIVILDLTNVPPSIAAVFTSGKIPATTRRALEQLGIDCNKKTEPRFGARRVARARGAGGREVSVDVGAEPASAPQQPGSEGQSVSSRAGRGRQR